MVLTWKTRVNLASIIILKFFSISQLQSIIRIILCLRYGSRIWALKSQYNINFDSRLVQLFCMFCKCSIITWPMIVAHQMMKQQKNRIHSKHITRVKGQNFSHLEGFFLQVCRYVWTTFMRMYIYINTYVYIRTYMCSQFCICKKNLSL